MFKVIICDPDGKIVEGRNTGFFYTMLSRATTLGDPNGLNSAIYFTGPNLTKQRIQELTLKTNSLQVLGNVKRRTAWVQYLENHILDTSNISNTQMQNLFQWTQTRIPYDILYKRTQKYIQFFSIRQ
jgi:hypothetical protein